MSDVVEQVFADEGTQPGSADLTKVIELLRWQTSSPPSDEAHDVRRSEPTWHRGTYADFVLLKGAELCEALAYAHRLRVWHCDVKPSNVLLTTDGRALLLDFNLAVRDDDGTGLIGGTLPYMTPEQLQHVVNSDQPAPPIDHRTDLFALGVTMFQLLTGRLPFPTANLPQNRIEAARQLLELQRVQRDWCGELEGVISPQAARVIGDCLAFDPQKRPESAAEVAQQFRRELATGARVRRWIRSHRWSLSIATFFLLVVASIFGIGMSYRTPAHLRQYQLGLDYLDAGDYARARQCFDEALDVRKDFREALIMRGWTDLLTARQEGLEKTGRDELQRSAAEYFREAHRLQNCAESAASLAQCLTETEPINYQDAGAYYDIARGGDFWTAAVANNLGLCFYRNGQLESAADVLSEALIMDSALSAAHWNLLRLRERFGRLVIRNEFVALENLQKAMDQIKVMRESAPESADLELEAARIFVMALAVETSASKEGTEQRQRELLEQVLESCKRAIGLNLDPANLQDLENRAPQLKGEVRFQQLLLPRSAAPPIPADPIKEFVDIFPEVKGRLARTTPET